MKNNISTPFSIQPNGIIPQATQINSPNFDERPDGCKIDMVVIHNISLPPNQYGGDGIIQLFTNLLNPAEHPYYVTIYQAKVSAHFLIRRDGSLIQFVPCDYRAWHAGVSYWLGRECCNDFSIGIELEGSDFEAFTEAQYQTLNYVLVCLKKDYPIQHVVGHSQIAPERKTDPGPFFEWSRIYP